MILICPNCNARYLVAATVFASGPRQVRCARCSHTWQADLPANVAAMLAEVQAETTDALSSEKVAAPAVAPKLPPLTEPPAATTPIPPGSNLPAVCAESRWHRVRLWLLVFLFLLVLGVIVALVQGRQMAALRWPFLEPYYNALGMGITHGGQGLSLQQIHSERRYEGGSVGLSVEGEIHNDTASDQDVPDILALAIGPDGSVMRSWRIDAPTPKLRPGEVARFETVTRTPPGTVVEVKLSFAELSHDSEK